MKKNELLAELGRFADLDSEPAISSSGDSYAVKFTQDGDSVVLQIPKDSGKVTEMRGAIKKTYASYKGLLASPHFGNLKRFSEAQKALIRSDSPYIEELGKHLPIVGEFAKSESENSLFKAIDSWLARTNVSGPHVPLRTLVVDGPAGIGKTHLIQRLVYERAKQYGPGSLPPILHVQSRGRKLTTLNDVLAGTLQTLRVTLTYDQVPVLLRHGLLQLAIDGFDELADPNGYETAWGSLRDLIEELDNKGTLILSGRDTFINVDSVKKALPRLNSSDTLPVRLRPLSPNEAGDWLCGQGWAADRVQQLKDGGLLTSGSYALRPFYVRRISEFKQKKEIDRFLEFPLRALVSAIIDREAKLLERSFQGSKPPPLAEHVQRVLMEIARDMDDAESEAVDDSSLSIIADMVLGDVLSEEQLAIVRHRIKSIALMEPSTSNLQRRFSHTELQGYFSSLAYIDLVASKTVSKALRRNIIPTNQLKIFHDIASSLDFNASMHFFEGASSVLASRGFDDRSLKNVATLLLAALPVEVNGELQIKSIDGQSFDDIVLRGTINPIKLRNVEISQLDICDADISSVTFDACHVKNLVANTTSKVPLKCPTVESVQLQGGGFLVGEEALDWLSAHSGKNSEIEGSQKNEYLALLEKVCRVILRQYWIRHNFDDHGARLLNAPQWDAVKAVLDAHGMLRVRKNVAVGGPRSDFYRVEGAREILDPNCPDIKIKSIRRDVVALG
jgi:hypothetical protein